jgi:putative oxidoreductase
MNRLFQHVASAVRVLDESGDWILPSLARFAFAAVLMLYFWASAATKFDGVLTPSLGAYAQIYPRAFEAAGYDPRQLSLFAHLVVLLGGWAEVVLPLMVVLGLFTRLAALGMIGFVAVQSLTDIYGHLVDAATIGAWFDRVPDAAILDQRALWVVVLGVLVFKGAGPVSLDWVLRKWAGR